MKKLSNIYILISGIIILTLYTVGVILLVKKFTKPIIRTNTEYLIETTPSIENTTIITQLQLEKEQLRTRYDSIAKVLKIASKHIKTATVSVTSIKPVIDTLYLPNREHFDSLTVSHIHKDYVAKTTILNQDSGIQSLFKLHITPDTVSSVTYLKKNSLFKADEYVKTFHHTNTLFSTSMANSVSIKVPKDILVVSAGVYFDPFKLQVGPSINIGVKLWGLKK